MARILAGLAGPYGAGDAGVLAGTAPDVLCTGHDTAVDAAIKTPGP